MKAFAAIVVGLICAASRPAWAGTPSAETATAVKNIYDPILSNYQVRIAETGCLNEGVCTLIAPAVAKTTLIQHVSCTFSISTAVVIASAYLQDANLTGFFNVLNPFSFSIVGPSATHGINADTFLMYRPGLQPRIDIGLVGGGPDSPVSCTLSGYHL